MTQGTVLILGGASDIGLAIAHGFAKEGHPIRLAVRDPEKAEPDRADIQLRHGVSVSVLELDILNYHAADQFFDGMDEIPQVVVCAVGMLGDQKKARNDSRHAEEIVRSNFLGPALYLEKAAQRMASAGGRRAIIGIGSVAGDRGRASNYWYGAAKAAFSTMLSGLRQEHSSSGLVVITVLPGFVDTKMIADLKVPQLLTSQPEDVSKRVLDAYRSSSTVIYVGRKWRLIMMIIKSIPERIFLKLRF